MDLEQQLRAALVPCRPGPQLRMLVMARVSVAPKANSSDRRATSRRILFGVVLAVAAAAALLVARLAPAPVSPVTAAAPPAIADVPTVAGIIIAPIPDSSAQATQTAPESDRKNSEPVKAVSTITPFRVRIVPLQNSGQDVASRSAIGLFYSTLVDGLRAIPGATVIEIGSAENAGAISADYQLMLSGEGPLSGNNFKMTVISTSMGSLSGLGSDDNQMFIDLTPHCAGAGFPRCNDAASMAALELDRLRTRLFPVEVSQLRRLQARVRDTSLNEDERYVALSDYKEFSARATAAGHSAADGFPALRDSAVVGAAIRIASSADANMRRQIWRTMRGSSSVELIQPLIAALRGDPSGEVRAEAATTLVADFSSNPEVEAALEAASRGDSNSTVRALATRETSGGESWNTHVVESLKDTSLPDTERVEALFRTLSQNGPTPDLHEFLDDAQAVHSFVEIVSKTSANSLPGGTNATMTLFSNLGRIGHPAVTGLLLDVLTNSKDTLVRVLAASSLATGHDEPRVRAALEKISTGDPDPQVRDAVTTFLKPMPAEPTFAR